MNEEGRLTTAPFSPAAAQPEECGEVVSPDENGNDDDNTFLYILISEFWLQLKRPSILYYPSDFVHI